MGLLKRGTQNIFIRWYPDVVALQLEHAMKLGHSVLIPKWGIFNFLSSSVELCTGPLTA